MTATLGQIVDTALQIANDDGVDAVAIRAVAARLGISPMSLYRFIASKGDLLDEIVIRVLDLIEVPPPGPGDDWIDRVVQVMGVWRALLLEHPVVVQILVDRRLPGQSEGLARLEENVLAALEEAGITGDEAVGAFWQVFSFAFGHIVFERARVALDDREQTEAGARMAHIARARKMSRVAALADRLTYLPARKDFGISMRALLVGIETTTRPSADLPTS